MGPCRRNPHTLTVISVNPLGAGGLRAHTSSLLLAVAGLRLLVVPCPSTRKTPARAAAPPFPITLLGLLIQGEFHSLHPWDRTHDRAQALLDCAEAARGPLPPALLASE